MQYLLCQRVSCKDKKVHTLSRSTASSSSPAKHDVVIPHVSYGNC